jgi:hypothetical protein
VGEVLPLSEGELLLGRVEECVRDSSGSASPQGAVLGTYPRQQNRGEPAERPPRSAGSAEHHSDFEGETNSGSRAAVTASMWTAYFLIDCEEHR